eukprot:TRINITY_DN325_c0_g1::TRINITY_DN325_c0_g1_i2::g.7407::m.7407 TRINITY_DN325_c0_g1::TRINITY_DN325_c0_g1_i2::g.7407  ORF type:complete len:369 (-),score=18.80,sp/Q80Y55/BSDC1_MOUSE/29.15/3e-18,BSD/PF03909.12/2e-10,SCIMP/PF15050.1/0.17,Tape_meas_lam_C/PF09718.5/0.84,Tape_meas_lam_C/PF09718.5/3.1e+03,Tape_meas_lam_C/PF09718.5/2.6e+03 TRINITY_DN325_c0_g1_i2:321-1427(-)
MDWLIGNTTESTDETPQENSAQPASGYSIWGQLKKMSTNVIEMYKEDLNEFATTVVHDTKEFTHHIKTENEEEPSQEKGESHLGLSYLASKVVKSVDNLTAKIDSLGETVMQTLSTAVIVPDQPTQHQSANGFDRLSSRIMAAQNDPNTFLEPPSDQKAFTEFITVFDVNQHDHDIVSVMRSNQNMSQLYDRIVPSAVSRETFWSRYFFTIHHIYRDEERRAALVQQADAVEELEVGWGDDDDDTTSAFVDEPAAVLETQVPNSNSIPASVDQDGQNVSQSIEQGISELEITDPPRFESLVGSQISQVSNVFWVNDNNYFNAFFPSRRNPFPRRAFPRHQNLAFLSLKLLQHRVLFPLYLMNPSMEVM